MYSFLTDDPAVELIDRGVRTFNRSDLQTQPQETGSPHQASPYHGGGAGNNKMDRLSSYRNASLELRSRSPSPNPMPVSIGTCEYYGTSNLTDRSRSPSPTLSLDNSTTRRRGVGGGSGQGTTTARKLPVMPQKPSALNLIATDSVPRRIDDRMPHVLPSPTIPPLAHKSPGSINFPRLNASPSHGPYNSAEWNDPRGDGQEYFVRSASSQQLNKTESGQYSSPRGGGGSGLQQRPPPDREHYTTSQVLQPSSAHTSYGLSPARRTADSSAAPDRGGRQRSSAVVMQEGGGYSTLPRRSRPDERRRHNAAEANIVRRKPTNSDSEDEDWC